MLSLYQPNLYFKVYLFKLNSMNKIYFTFFVNLHLKCISFASMFNLVLLPIYVCDTYQMAYNFPLEGALK